MTENLPNGGAAQFGSVRTYDGAGNVIGVQTTLPQGTDSQAFCYDEQNRLTWASSASGSIPCGGTNTAGTLTSAQYTQSSSYEVFNRLTSGPLGTYTYGNSAHQDAATAIGGTYTASYDADGSMTCRAPTSSVTCTGSSPTGQQMTYDAERRLSTWASGPGSTPTNETANLYDGEGMRVEQMVLGAVCSPTCTEQTQSDTLYLAGGAEEQSTAGGTTTTTKYYGAGGLLIGVSVTGTISYLASDGLGSVSVALSSSGTLVAAQLYGPYGGMRYSSGSMPTARGFTGQYGDAVSGLDYYHARYYDPVAGQFISADSIKGGQGPNRYAYVGGNPETRTDPTGQRCTSDEGCGGGGSNGGGTGTGSGGTPPPIQVHQGRTPCDQVCQLKTQIPEFFHDSRTQAVMQMLLNSGVGIEFLQYLLAVGESAGDSFITWDLTDPTEYGYTSWAGDISLNPLIFKRYGTGTKGLIETAGVLVHEAVESFYANAYNVRSQASQHMDYVAEWYAGEVKQELALQFKVPMPGGSAYLMTFAQWQATLDFQDYAWEPVNQPEATNTLEPSASYTASHFTAGFPDPMGLNLDTLTAAGLAGSGPQNVVGGPDVA